MKKFEGLCSSGLNVCCNRTEKVTVGKVYWISNHYNIVFYIASLMLIIRFYEIQTGYLETVYHFGYYTGYIFLKNLLFLCSAFGNP